MFYFLKSNFCLGITLAKLMLFEAILSEVVLTTTVELQQTFPMESQVFAFADGRIIPIK